MWLNVVFSKQLYCWGRLFAGWVCLVLSTLATSASSQEVVPPEKWEEKAYTGDLDAIAEGKVLWKNIGCYSCHGRQAEGGVGPNLSDDVWVYKPTDKSLYNTIFRGRSGTNMVGWSKDLTPDEIWKLVAFIRSLYVGDPSKIIW